MDEDAATADPFEPTFRRILEQNITMTAPHIVDPAGLLGEALAEATPDLMRSLLQSISNACCPPRPLP